MTLTKALEAKDERQGVRRVMLMRRGKIEEITGDRAWVRWSNGNVTPVPLQDLTID